MIFAFNEDAGARQLTLKGERFKYLIKARRHRENDRIMLRHPHDSETLFTYRVETINGREARLQLEESQGLTVGPARALHVGWCIIDPKSVEKVIATLNEIGVSRITFVTCKRSQSSFRIDTERLERLLEASMQQCGRSQKMHIDFSPSVEAFLHAYPECRVLDFGGECFEERAYGTVLVGCEGGFDEEERRYFKHRIRLDTPMVLRSESAVVALASKILL